MRDRPEQPADEAGELDTVELYHRGFAPDRRQIARVFIDERGGCCVACDARCDQASDIFPHLLCRGRDTGNRCCECRGIADRENFRMTRHAQVGADVDASGAILFGA
jgi:hypothetical protein